MESPFGHVSSRVVPRWPWSVLVASHIFEPMYCGRSGYRSHSGGARSMADLNSNKSAKTCSRMEGDSRGKAQPHGNQNSDGSSRTEIKNEFASQRIAESKGGEAALKRPQPSHPKQERLPATHRDVENAVEQSGEGRTDFGPHRVVPPRDVNRHCKQRLWACFPIVRHLYEARKSRTTREPNDLMSYQERLKCRELWAGGNHSFEIFLLMAPDCPDDVKAKLSEDAHQRSHGSYEREDRVIQAADLIPGRPVSLPLQINMCSTISTSSQTGRKSDSPPGEAAIRSFTPEGERSSTSPAIGVRKGPSTAENLIETRSSSRRLSNNELVETCGVKSSSKSRAKQQIKPTISSKSRSTRSIHPTRVIPRSTRRYRFHTPVKRDRILRNRITSPIRQRSAQNDEAEIEVVSSRVRTVSETEISQSASKDMAPPLTDQRKRTVEPSVNSTEIADKVESSSPPNGSHNDRSDGNEMPVHPGVAIVQLGPSETITTRQAPTAYVRLTDLTTPKSCYQIRTCQNHTDVEEADRSQLPTVSSTANNQLKTATSYFNLVDSAAIDPSQLKIPKSFSEEVDTWPTFPNPDTGHKLPDPSRSYEIPSSSISYSEPRGQPYGFADNVDVVSNRTSSNPNNPEEARLFKRRIHDPMITCDPNLTFRGGPVVAMARYSQNW
ncbi:hypothetical protein R1flu_019323 [Riccia fluitans]|uniref:Uncharacterized protein n=1 Tax=Riccia fluitans TaxID=41844 RepID=A0ABD1ZIC4_9MARC